MKILDVPSISEFGEKAWRELDIVAFDTETTGQYPLGAEICELAAVKWRGGKIIGTFQTLLKPSADMSAEVIAIHGITNEMVADAPRMSDKIGEFHDFIRGAVTVAHHAPFDLGFLSVDFENFGKSLPPEPALCSSLLARKIFPESENHRLQTLIGFFGLQRGQAHRALDDAAACLEVALRCLGRLGDTVPLKLAFDAQGGPLTWRRFSLRELESENAEAQTVIRAIREKRNLDIRLRSGQKSSKIERVEPLGIVRSLDGDYFVAHTVPAMKIKPSRYSLQKVLEADIV